MTEKIPSPSTTRTALRPELDAHKFERKLRRLAAELPTDEFSFAVVDDAVRDHFGEVASFEEFQRQEEEARTDAQLTTIDQHITTAQGRLNEKVTEHDRHDDELSSEHARLGGIQIPDEPVLDRDAEKKTGQSRVDDKSSLWALIPVPTIATRVLIAVAALWSLVVDWVNFSTAVQLLNSHISTTMNNALASGFTTAAAAMSIKIGRRLAAPSRAAQRKARARARRVASALGTIAFVLTLLAIIVLSFIVRLTHSGGTASNPFGVAGASKAFSWFGTGGGLLSASFFTLILIASVLTTIDEARIAAKFGPYLRAIWRARRSGRALTKARAKMQYLAGRRAEWVSFRDSRVAARDAAIVAHAFRINEFFRLWRQLLAIRVGDPVVTDTIAFAPRIDLTTDVPDFDLPFLLTQGARPEDLAQSA